MTLIIPGIDIEALEQAILIEVLLELFDLNKSARQGVATLYYGSDRYSSFSGVGQAIGQLFGREIAKGGEGSGRAIAECERSQLPAVAVKRRQQPSFGAGGVGHFLANSPG